MTELKRTAENGPFNKAADLYGLYGVEDKDSVLTRIPRSKNQFELSFSMKSSTEEVVFGRVAQVSLPAYDFNVQTLNQYNRLRHYPTAARPQPFQVTFYDTRDSEFQFILEDYAAFYSHGLQVNEQTVYKYDTIAGTFDRTFGIKATGDGSNRYFFDRITITTIDATKGSAKNTRTIDCFNCMINTASHDTLDYSTANPVMWQVSFQPEHVNIRSDADVVGQSSREPRQVFESIEGSLVFAVDEFGDKILDSITGSPRIIRTLNQVSDTISAFNAISETGERLIDELGNFLT